MERKERHQGTEKLHGEVNEIKGRGEKWKWLKKRMREWRHTEWKLVRNISWLWKHRHIGIPKDCAASFQTNIFIVHTPQACTYTCSGPALNQQLAECVQSKWPQPGQSPVCPKETSWPWEGSGERAQLSKRLRYLPIAASHSVCLPS